jgi:REP element-mobilizing transposase RayT
MPKPRSQLVSPEATPFYHCISRCVRRAFLCGEDRVTGKSFDHRKAWVVDRIKELSALFAVDVLSYAVLSNHFHLVLYLDLPRRRGWTEEEVCERYGKLFPNTVERARGLPRGIWTKRVALWRARLGDLSWFMRCLNESIARRANQEDGCTGRFWEGRFRSQALLDEGAVLTCMSYVDLNPVRAGMASSIEESEFTSIRERILAVKQGKDVKETGLVPFKDQTPRGATPLTLPFADYVEVLRWTAASVRQAQQEPPPAGAESCLSRLGLDSGGFIATIRTYARSFFTMVGTVHRIDTESGRRGYKRRPGIRAARNLYRRSEAA